MSFTSKASTVRVNTPVQENPTPPVLLPPQQPASRPFSLLNAFLWLFNLMLLAFLIWMSVLIAQTSGSTCTGTNLGCVGDYVVAENVVAEPYSGPPTKVTTNITSSAVCQATCTASNDCLFFTHDRTNGSCYFYNSSTLLLQNKNAAVVGPSNLIQGNVYVKNTGRLVQTRNKL